MKRALSPTNGALSPPPLKRKIESTTTNRAVASFFTPASQKGPEKLTWRIIDRSLIIARYDPLNGVNVDASIRAKPRKIAALDLDDTIIRPTGAKWARSATSWKWWDLCVPGKLKELHRDGYLVVIVSNQAIISLKDKDTTSLRNFRQCIGSLLPQLDIPISIYAATGQDKYRKPRIGMWHELLEDHDLEAPGAVDLEGSVFVGDASGRPKTENRPRDHSSSDRDLATNIGITFKTPEEFFKNEPPETYERIFEPLKYLADQDKDDQESAAFTKRNAQDLVVFCGSPGAGKSTFFWETLKPLGYERVNQDILKTRDKCLKVASDYLTAGRSVAVDNTNADVQARAYWTRLAQDFGIMIRCVRFTAPARLCEHNDAVRALNPDTVTQANLAEGAARFSMHVLIKQQMNPEKREQLPGIAFKSFAQRYVVPTMAEGFQDIYEVNFKFRGTPEQRKIWSMYWLSKTST